jgi:hypothetical protein
MARNFYYGKDRDIVAGSKNFASLIGSDAEAYGIPPERAALYVAADAELQSAFHAATTPETRTPVAVSRKDIALKRIQKEAAVLAKLASSTETVSDAQLVALGLQPRKARASRVLSGTPPRVSVVSVLGRIVRVAIRAQEPESGRMPAAAVGAHVYTFVGSEPPTDARLYDFHGLAPRATYEIVFPNEVPSGATVWVSAAWVSKRGPSGMACTPVSTTLQGGPVLAAA